MAIEQQIMSVGLLIGILMGITLMTLVNILINMQKESTIRYLERKNPELVIRWKNALEQARENKWVDKRKLEMKAKILD